MACLKDCRSGFGLKSVAMQVPDGMTVEDIKYQEERSESSQVGSPVSSTRFIPK